MKTVRAARRAALCLHRTSYNAFVGAGFSCPPSCQPIPGHCCGRQSGHFLEIASLHPPLAALRRFPRPREGQSPSPTHRKIRFRRGRPPGRPARTCTAPLVTDAGRCGHRPLRNPIGKPSVGADAPVRPPISYCTHGKARGPCPTKMPCRAGPMCPAAHRSSVALFVPPP